MPARWPSAPRSSTPSRSAAPTGRWSSNGPISRRRRDAVLARPLLDRIIELEPGGRARGLRNVPNTLEVFDSHFPRFPVLPGVLVLDTLAELAELALGGPPGEWRLSGIRRAQFRRYVAPGDQLELSVQV